MDGKPRYLTKSRFKVAYECPAKLYYNDRPEVYGNKNRDNEFLRALAHGGYQVGALAKLYYPGGIDLDGLKTAEAIARTRELLLRENVTIFEAAIQSGPFLVLVDILDKKGNDISLIEVKSKSHDFANPDAGFFKKRDPGIDSHWEPYLIDVTFQTWVANQANPDWQIYSYLMLVDKSARASRDGLHQRFLIRQRANGRPEVVVRDGTDSDSLGDPVLRLASVQREVAYLLTQELFPTGEKLPEFAKYLAEHHTHQTRALARVSSICKSCEFRIGPELKADGFKSAFEECWTDAGKLDPTTVGKPLIFDIWNCRKTEELLSRNKVFFDQVTEDDLRPKSKPKKPRSLEPYQRQMIQIDKQRRNDPAPHLDRVGLATLLDGVTYPLHCIDFETTTVAIPFHAGRRPYEQIAFQFSHHVLNEDGSLAHVDQHLDLTRGRFPNFEFARRLMKSLSGDRGTIFRYAAHENTVLRPIREQLLETPEPDTDELIGFIDEITQPRDGEGGTAGDRNMIDLRQVVLDHYYHPLMGGSNSIKKVIPAVVAESRTLKEKYAAPIYGRGKEIPSLNFEDMTWIKPGPDGRVTDPYKLLPPVFGDLPQSLFDDAAPLFQDESIDDGGAAMTAWSRAQFTEMTDTERDAIEASLLKYCELDTLSMIWLLEYWRGELAR